MNMPPTTNPIEAAALPTVLLAEDEDVVREVMAQMLTTLGYNVLEAENGRQAMELFSSRRQDIDLVIFDLSMPAMNGAELFDRLRRQAPEVKTLLTTGHDELAEVRRMRHSGLSGFLPKPFTLTEMRRAVDEVMGAC